MARHNHTLMQGEPLKYPVQPDDSLPAVLRLRAKKHPHDIAVMGRTSVGSPVPMTTSEIARRVEDTARGLIGLGIEPGESVSILSNTSFDWMILDLAIMSVGAVTVPIYESDSTEQIKHILNDAHVVYVFTATSQQAELVASIHAPSVRHVDAIDTGAFVRIDAASRDVAPAAVDRRMERISSTDLATIIYTSGTTGNPKGVELTHGNFVGQIRSIQQFAPDIVDAPDTCLLVYLPLAHVFARIVMHTILAGRGYLAFSPSMATLMQDFQMLKPTVMVAVPRVLEKVVDAARAKAGSGLKGKIFAWSIKQARLYGASLEKRLGPGLLLKMRHGVAKKLVLSKIVNALGPKLRYVVVGGAPLAYDTNAIFLGLGLRVIQGYGLSETTGPIAGQNPNRTVVATLGGPLPGNTIKLAPDGEILMKGVCVFPGYHGLPEANQKAFQDGWFYSGDFGSIDRHRQLRITGRKKELIVTAGGKNVQPEILENALGTHPLIEHVVVVGDNRPFIGALITLASESLPGWLQSHGLPVMTPAQAASNSAVQMSLHKAIERANHAVSRAESIRDFRIINANFTVENGYLTPSLKLRRSLVVRDFADQIDALYSEASKRRHSQGESESKQHKLFNRGQK